MIHTALARKYRPTRFADLVGQDHVAAGISGAVAKDRVAHAYLLTGPRGVGKTTAARILAMALNCEKRAETQGEPCGSCDSCTRIWSGSANLDVVEIDAASNRGVDDARELRERAMYAASGPDRFKVYIVDEAHMLTREAWNALLKILEEPPPRVVFVFATTEPQKIANTAAPVLSRVQQFDFRRIGPGAIQTRLRQVADSEGLSAEDSALALLARAADGGLRDALSMLDQVVAFGDGSITEASVRDALGLIGDELYRELVDILVRRSAEDVFPFVERLVESGGDLGEFIAGASEVLRSLLVAKYGGEPQLIADKLTEVAASEAFTAGDILRMIKLLGEVETNVRRSANPRLHVEALLLQWTLLDRTVELDELLDGLAGRRSAGGSRGSSGGSRQADRGTPRRAPAVEPAQKRTGPLSIDDVKRGWDAILEVVGRKSPMLREALRAATPAAVDGSAVRLIANPGGGHYEGLERAKTDVARAIENVTGAAVTVKVVEGAEPEGPPAGRIDRETDKEERLKSYRSRDTVLDEAVETMNLELLE
ncbi:MAG: DNA polymerase III subunit gamma/tau [Gemmatimonadales bacterium]